MNPFEDLLKELGSKIGTSLTADRNQSCRLEIEEGFYVQIDLDSSGERILIGCNLGRLRQGSYRNALIKQAMRTNSAALTPRGILAYSKRNDSLILFQYFTLVYCNAETLYEFIQLFIAHARIWYDSLLREEIPQIEEGAVS